MADDQRDDKPHFSTIADLRILGQQLEGDAWSDARELVQHAADLIEVLGARSASLPMQRPNLTLEQINAFFKESLIPTPGDGDTLEPWAVEENRVLNELVNCAMRALDAAPVADSGARSQIDVIAEYHRLLVREWEAAYERPCAVPLPNDAEKQALRNLARLIEANCARSSIAPPKHRYIYVYPNGDWTAGNEEAAKLFAEFAYNVRMRPGRAIVIDGITVYEGINVSADLIAAAIEAAAARSASASRKEG